MLLVPRASPWLTFHSYPDARIGPSGSIQTAAPWQGRQTTARLKQNFECTNLLLQLVAATLIHRGIAYKLIPGTCIQHSMEMSKAAAKPSLELL